MADHQKSKYFLAGIVPYIIWGTMSVPLRNLKSFPPQEILYYRIAVSVLMVWAIILIFRKKTLIKDLHLIKELPVKQKGRLLLFTVLSAFLITGNWFSYIYAVNNVSLKAAAFAYMICPLLTALCGFIILKEQLTKAKVIALVVAMCSILLLATGSLHDVLWALLVASFYALYVIILKVIHQVDKFNFLGAQLILSGIMMLPLYFFNAGSIPSAPAFWSQIILIAVVFTIIPLFLNSYALIGMPSSELGILIYVNPIVAFTVAFFYFNEQVDMQQLAAYLLLLLSVIIFNIQLLKGFTSKSA